MVLFLRLIAISALALTACGIQASVADSKAAGRNDAGLVEVEYATPTEGTVLQVFNWPFDKITEKIPEFAKIGYTHLHVSPPSLSIPRLEWWARYQPLDYRVIDGPLGNEEQFAKMNQAADSYGIKIVIDLVLNHMANADFARYNTRYTDNPEVLYYPDPRSREKYGTSILFEPADFNQTGCIGNYDDRIQVVYNRLCLGFPDKGLPDLNLDRPNVVNAQRNYLRKLINLGVDGFRIDALKHLPPSYLNTLLSDIDQRKTLIFGEIITNDQKIQRDIGPYYNSSEISFYDFPLLFLMKQAFGPSGSLRTLINPVAVGSAINGSRSISFVTNHDIPNNGDIFRFLKFYDRQEEHLAYTYIMARAESMAYVYTDLGRSNGLDSDEYVDAYADPVLSKLIGFRRIVAGTKQTYFWESDQTLVWGRGSQVFVVINKSGDQAFSLQNVAFVGIADGEYVDLLTGLKVTLKDQKLFGKPVAVSTRSSALFVPALPTISTEE